MVKTCTSLADVQGEPGADCDISNKGENYLKTDLGGLQKNMKGGKPAFQSLYHKNKTKQNKHTKTQPFSEGEDMSQETLPMKVTQISFQTQRNSFG